MFPKRVRQFIMNLTDKMSEDDYKYAQLKLNKEEYECFKSISKSEQKHSIRVAREIEKISSLIKKGDNFENGYELTNGEILSEKIISNAKNYLLKNEENMIKIGLLHDIGKSRQRINIIDKSIIVILNKLTKGKLAKINLKKIQCYYNHSEYSYEILKEIYDLYKKEVPNLDEKDKYKNFDKDSNKYREFLEIIKNHHNENYKDNEDKNSEVNAEMSESNGKDNKYSYNNKHNKLECIIKFFQGVDDGN